MKHLSKEHLVPFIMAGNNVLDLIPRYNTVVDKLVALETQIKQMDAAFDISTMWTCTCINGQLLFDITGRCADLILQNKLLDIFGV